MKVEFAVEAISADEVSVNFDAFLSSLEVTFKLLNGTEKEVEVFNHTIEALETF